MKLRIGALIVSVVIGGGLLVPVTRADAATFQLEGSKCSPPSCESGATIYRVRMFGKIVKGDYQRLINVIRKAKPYINKISLYSPGGDVLEAVRIGRLIRRLKIGVSIPAKIDEVDGEPYANFMKRLCESSTNPRCNASIKSYDVVCGKEAERIVGRANCVCASACVFVFAAAVAKRGNHVVVHRPYFGQEYFKGLSASEAEKKYEELTRSVRSYLSEIEMSEEFSNLVFSVPSTEGRVLSNQEVDHFFPKIAPFYEEWMIARCNRVSDADQKMYNDLMNRQVEVNANVPWAKPLSRLERLAYTALENEVKKVSHCRARAHRETLEEVFRQEQF